MPPEISSCHHLITTLIHFQPQDPPRSLASNRKHLSYKYHRHRGTKKMQITKRKLIPILVFILFSISVFRLLKITITTSSSSSYYPSLVALAPSLCLSSSPACGEIPSHTEGPSENKTVSFAKASNLTKKEFRFLSRLISQRAPCNLLIFGLETQHTVLSSKNAGGTTIFLEDNPEKLNTVRTNSNNTRIYKVEYQTKAREAYKLLKHARRNTSCAPHSGVPLKKSSCKLALTKLPREVYKVKWDVVVVDGPSGDTPDAPGRMAAIYTASMIARSGNATDVVVHDVDRMIEKWFSWEFLCDQNLVSSKGKLWNFRIEGQSNSTTFCPAKENLIE